MNKILSRSLQTMCTVVLTAMLSACGSGSTTVDPFVPTRVIGLGDGYNDETSTVREAGSTTGSVVGQVAAYFGQSNVVSYARGEKRIADLTTQIASAGNLSSTDLVVITVGTFDLIDGMDAATAAQALVTQVRSIKNAGATHILIMPVLDVSRTPWGRANSFSTTATNTFNTELLTALSTAFGGTSQNSVIFANASGVTSYFLTATSQATYSPFTDTGYDGTPPGTSPACGDATVFGGCAASDASANYATMLFADGIHLTPAGNRWVAQYLFTGAAQGWR